MSKFFHSVRGTSDFYPPDSVFFENIIQKAKEVFSVFGYEEIILPHLEEDGLFKKGVGEITDIAQRQMFKIEGKNVVLRPEGTAQVARFYIENSIYKQKGFCKFYYIGSMFRGERPQKGRLREFHHIGAEAIGSDNFYLDAEVIDAAMRIVRDAGIKDVTLKINSLGCAKDKERLSYLIKDKLSSKAGQLCDDCKRRLATNPLRVLDCKREGCRNVVSSMKIDNYLCDLCYEHFHNLLSLLDDIGIPYKYDPLLVRGLDYYTNTVFEISSSNLGSQDAIGAGGRYNNLIKNLGGPDVPAVGFALGIERILLLQPKTESKSPVDVLVAYTSDFVYKNAYDTVRRLRDLGISSVIDYRNKSLKAQLKWAQKTKIPYAVIVGDEELRKGCIIVRNMRKSIQQELALSDFSQVIKSIVKNEERR